MHKTLISLAMVSFTCGLRAMQPGGLGVPVACSVMLQECISRAISDSEVDNLMPASGSCDDPVTEKKWIRATATKPVMAARAACVLGVRSYAAQATDARPKHFVAEDAPRASHESRVCQTDNPPRALQVSMGCQADIGREVISFPSLDMPVANFIAEMSKVIIFLQSRYLSQLASLSSRRIEVELKACCECLINKMMQEVAKGRMETPRKFSIAADGEGLFQAMLCSAYDHGFYLSGVSSLFPSNQTLHGFLTHELLQTFLSKDNHEKPGWRILIKLLVTSVTLKPVVVAPIKEQLSCLRHDPASYQKFKNDFAWVSREELFKLADLFFQITILAWGLNQHCSWHLLNNFGGAWQDGRAAGCCLKDNVHSWVDWACQAVSRG